MSRHSFRLLGGTSSPSSSDTAAFDSDFIVILAALLCALVCVLGLVAVARCAWLRRLSGGGTPPPPPNKGLKKKVLRALPKHTFMPEASVKLSDCAICLVEFAAGDQVRVLPQCGHGFHVACIDTWLGSHSSCPSCRQVLVLERCQRCGSLPGRSKGREDDVNWFLP